MTSRRRLLPPTRRKTRTKSKKQNEIPPAKMSGGILHFVEDFHMENDFQSERADFDGLWKDAIQRFFPQLIQRTLPELYDDVDFSREPEFLSKELSDSIQRPVVDEHNSPLFVDELIKIFLKDGRTEWILLHIEIQGSYIVA